MIVKITEHHVSVASMSSSKKENVKRNANKAGVGKGSVEKAPTTPKQPRAEKTRQKLIDASIECLAKHGYAGSQLGMISDLAGVSRRPRQYYFPSRISLMLAVWHEIRRRDDADFANLHSIEQPLEKTVELILEFAFKKYRTPQYLADLELKLAMRSDDDLARELAPLIEQRETEADELWLALFAEVDKPAEQIIATRYLHVSLLRGLAIEYLSRQDTKNLAHLEQEFTRTLHSVLA